MVINNVPIILPIYVSYVKYIYISPILLMLTLTTAAQGEAEPFRQKRQASRPSMSLLACPRAKLVSPAEDAGLRQKRQASRP